MTNFTFYNPTKLIVGKGKIKEIGKEISTSGFNNILLIAGKGSIKENGVYEQVINSLKENKINHVEIWEVQPNPTLTKADEAIQLAKENKVDAILAVGGGSVIDTAKSVAAGYFLKSAWDAYEGKEIKQALPIFTVLTLSATGSEMNSGAVLTNEKEQKKWSMTSSKLFPLVSIIDPEIQMSLPWKQTAHGAADAISHVLEYYFIGTNQETTLALDESLIRSIITVTDKLQVNGKDYGSRESLAWAATLALNGISKACISKGEWSPHRIEHGLSALFPEIAHGAGLAVIFPAWIKYVCKKNPSTFERWAKNVWECNEIEEAVEKMKSKYKSWGLPISLSELKIENKDLENIAEKIMEKGSFGVLKSLNKEDVLEILRLAY
ncbi:MAG: iron-containing alcohol dehydrogenase [Candidatus Woesearchaeota archaeon]